MPVQGSDTSSTVTVFVASPETLLQPSLGRRCPGPWGQRGGAWQSPLAPPRLKPAVLPGTHILLLLVRQQSGHLFPFPCDFFLIVVELTDSEPESERASDRRSGPGSRRAETPRRPTQAYLFSLALVLKSSITFRNRVTVKRPPSLSSVISLVERSVCSLELGWKGPVLSHGRWVTAEAASAPSAWWPVHEGPAGIEGGGGPGHPYRFLTLGSVALAACSSPSSLVPFTRPRAKSQGPSGD